MSEETQATQIAALTATCRHLIDCIETLLTFKGSSHSLAGTQVAFAMGPSLEQAKSMLNQVAG